MLRNYQRIEYTDKLKHDKEKKILTCISKIVKFSTLWYTISYDVVGKLVISWKCLKLILNLFFLLQGN